MSKKKTSRGAGRRRRTTPIPDHILYTVCERFLRRAVDERTGKIWTADELATWLTTEKGLPTTREGIFPLVRLGIDKGFVVLRPPRVKSLFDELARRFPQLPSDTHILDVAPEEAPANITHAAAERLVELIRDVGRQKAGLPGAPARVHIGFSAGGAALAVANRLAFLMRDESGLPPLTLHTITSGFDITDPHGAPATLFPAFRALNHPIEYIGLYTTAVVNGEHWSWVRHLPDVEQCFEAAKEIDIVVTSLAQAGDKHGLLNRFLVKCGGDAAKLAAQHYVGDVQFQPFSATGPIDADTGIRAVTLFDLPGLVELARSENKHVLLVAGPCIKCGTTKSHALLPLLRQPTLRVCNHLVTDSRTAQEVLQMSAQYAAV